MHLSKLVDGGMLVVEPRGRQRLYRLASQKIADALEVLVLVGTAEARSSLRAANERDDLAARGCATTTSPAAPAW